MKKKITAICLVVALAATAIVGGTLAYFTDTKTEVNEFTVGNVDITLTESEWNPSDAKLIPGREIAKNPTITVAESSERAYTFMKVQLSQDFITLLTDYAEAKEYGLEDVDTLIDEWFVSAVRPKVMYTDVDEGYVILGVLSPKEAKQSVTYFDAVTVPDDVDEDMINPEGDYTITVTAYAIQAEGFEGVNADDKADRQAAFDALFPELA